MPVCDSLIRLIYKVNNVLARKPLPHIVICIMSCLLQIDKRLGNIDEFRLERVAFQSGTQFLIDIVLRKHLSYLVHIAMRECTPQTVSQGRS